MKKILFGFIAICLLVGGLLAYLFYQKIFQPNVDLGDRKEISLFIPTDSDFDKLKTILDKKNVLKDLASFTQVAGLMKYKNVKSGHYILKDGWSNKQLISTLRSGNQTAIKVTFNNLRTIEDLSGYFAHRLEPDSMAFLNYFASAETQELYGQTPETMLSLFIPNTYEFYWNTNPEKLLKRLSKEQKKFYTDKRMTRLKAIGLNKKEVYTLASIVQKETLVNDEKPRVAGVYMNRLKRGQLLQADPTVVFANGDFSLRRVLNKHLEKDSPYNTYKYAGLPPGPIAMPDVSSIDAVLNYEKHKYLYFCATIDNSGRHQFAKTLVEHNNNANKYRAYLNKQRIFK